MFFFLSITKDNYRQMTTHSYKVYEPYYPIPGHKLSCSQILTEIRVSEGRERVLRKW